MEMTMNELNSLVEKKTMESTQQAANIQMEAMDDALWRMAQSNAMARIKGINQLAKQANDLG